MKYQYIGLLICGLPLCSMAQVTLTEAANAPQIGSEFHIHHQASVVDPGPAGTGQNWDLSALAGGSATIVHVEDPMGVAGTHLVRNEIDTFYYEVSSDGIYLVREETTMTLPLVGAQGITVDYTGDGVQMLDFPGSYGNTWQANIFGGYDVQGESFTRVGTVNGAIDGEGTLSLPSGTYADILRVYTLEETDEAGTLSGGTSAEGDRRAHTWSFYADWLKYPLLKISADTIFVTMPLPTTIPTIRTEWLDTLSVGIMEAIENNAAFGVWPTPASDVLNITLPVVQQGKVNGILRDLTGRIVREWNISSIGNTSVNVSDLPQGQYFLQLIGTSGEIGVRKVVVR